MSTPTHRLLRRIITGLGGAALIATGVPAFASGAAHTAPAALAAHAAPAAPAVPAVNGVPRPDHVVFVIFENTSAGSIVGNSQAPYFNQLASTGANFTNSAAIEHPSEPNYLDLFSGSNQGVTDDSCPHTFGTANEGAQLISAGLTFTGYSEDLPSAGSTVCTATGSDGGNYARKHNPWVNFSNVPAADNQPFTSFPTDFTQLPTVSWVVPNLCDDIHDCSIATGDTWLKTHLDAYVQWAKTHNSVLITTFDENDGTSGNQIATFFNGQPVKTGTYTEAINHFSVLRTVEDMYGLPYAGSAASATSITDAWSTGTTNTVAVTNPGSQTGTVGAAASLQISASDSASGQTLTYSATGLPAGLAINSSTGLISGTPTTAGTSSVTVKATDTTGASGSAAFSWTVNAAPNFSISDSPTSGSVTAGGSTTTTVSSTAVGGFSGSISYTASGLPSGATATFSPTSATVGTSSTLTLATISSTPAGTYPVVISGTSGSLVHTANYSLTVTAPGSNTVTVTNPGSQTTTVGAAASLQISASDSASGQTLTYSATGLPPGLSINSSTGLISGTPTVAGTYTVIIKVTDTTGASGSTTFSWTVNPVSGGCTAAQLLGNPGFETGTASPWTATAGVLNNSSSEPARTGSWDAWLDGYGTTHTDTLAQTVTIPATCKTANFSFWLHIDTAETTTTTQYDKLQVQVLNSSGTVLATLGTFSNLNHNTGYAQQSFSVAPYIGQTVTLKFTGKEDSTLQTSFVVDDTALNVN